MRRATVAILRAVTFAPRAPHLTNGLPERPSSIFPTESKMNLKPTRRIVTGHDAQGKAVALFDASVTTKQKSAGGNAITMLWVTAETPSDLTVSDRADIPVGVPPPT